MYSLEQELGNLKKEMVNIDIFGDAYDDLYKDYMNFIDTITNENKCAKMKELEKRIANDDLYYGEKCEMETVFEIINKIKM